MRYHRNPKKAPRPGDVLRRSGIEYTVVAVHYGDNVVVEFENCFGTWKIDVTTWSRLLEFATVVFEA